MKRRATFITLILAGFLTVGASSCNETSSADQKQAAATRSLMEEAERQVGMPAITNFQERRLMKLILELRDQEDLTTWAYIVDMHGKLHFIGKCIGFGLPASIQFTNPERVRNNTHQSFGTLPQPDPNGLFMPQGLTATWLMMWDETAKEARPVYIEPQIIVSPFPLH